MKNSRYREFPVPVRHTLVGSTDACLENENHPEGCAEGEYGKEKVNAKEETDAERNSDEMWHWVGFGYQFNQNLENP